MNQGIYRLLFNAAKGLWVVVGEIAKSRQKTGRRPLKRTQQTHQKRIKATLSPLRCALFFALGHLVFSAPLWADIIADTSAPGNQQATVLSTANGTPQVNIQTPSAGGVSRNQFSQFDVDAQGAILNNSRVNTTTQLGGLVSANPYLAGGSAAVLLMEVNSTNPSLLNGFMEVAGSRADIIFANPAGISCSGCGFINANQTVLTTGDVMLNGNNIDAYRVTDGIISINDDGLDATGSNFTHLISRSVELNAGIWAQDLQITTGTNEVAASDSSVTELGSGAGQPAFAIDVSALGGMYANVIRLVGTEDGVGVRNAGEIGASVGEFTLSVDGRLENTNIIVSAGNVTLSATNEIDNSDGEIHSDSGISITAENVLNTNGAITALSDIAINTDGDLINQSGSILSNGHVTVDGNVTTDARNINNAEGLIQSQLTMTLTADTINNTDSGTTAGILAGQALTLSADQIDNSQGYIESAAAVTVVSTGEVNNAQGVIEAAGDIDITASKLNNEEGLVRTSADLAINTQSGELVNSNTGSSGGLIAGEDIDIRGASVANDSGYIGAVGNIALTTTGDIDNRQGEVITNKALTANATNIDNREGSLRAQEDITLDVGAGTLQNDEGFIESNGAVDIVAATITNTLTRRSIVLVDDDGNPIYLSDVDGNFILDEDGDEQLQYVLTKGIVGDTVTIAADTVDNRDGQIVADITQVTADVSIDNSEGLIKADAGLNEITTHTLTQSETSEISGVDTQISVSDTFTNRGLVNSSGETRVDTETLLNYGTGRIYGDHIIIDAETLKNHKEGNKSAAIAARTELDIGVTTLDNRDGSTIYSDGDMDIGGDIDNDGQATGTANTITNASATIEALNNLSIDANTLDNIDPSFTVITPTNPIVTTINSFTTLYTWEDMLGATAPGRIISGGDSILFIHTLDSINSELTAGGDLTRIGSAFKNKGTEGNKKETEVGEKIIFGVCNNFFCLSKEYYEKTTNSKFTLLAPIFEGNNDKTNGLDIDDNAILNVSNQNAGAGGVDSNTRTLAGIDVSTTSSLFSENASPDATYLVETDAQFTDSRQWLSSSYVTDQLATSPDVTNKRLGDGFYEQRVVRDQIVALTGYRFLNNYSNDETQYRALLDNGITFAQAHNIRPGIQLSAEQMSQLTSDIVWLEEQEIVLANGGTQQVLVPKVYALVNDGDLLPSGSLISANNIDITNTNFSNGGSLFARNAIQVSAKNVVDTGGRLQASRVSVNADDDITLEGSQWQTSGDLILNAGRDIAVRSQQDETTQSDGAYYRYMTRKGRLTAGNGGTASQLNIAAGRNAAFSGVALENNSSGDTTLQAGNKLVVDTIIETDRRSGRGMTYSSQNEVTSQIDAKGDINLLAGGDLLLRGAGINTDQSLQLEGENINLTTAENKLNSHVHGGGYAFINRSLKNEGVRLNAGDNVTINAGDELNIYGATAAGGADITLSAENDISIQAAQDESYQYSRIKKKKSWGRSKTTIKESFATRNVGGDLTAGNNLTINSTINPDDSVTANENSGDVTVRGGKLTGDNSVAVSGDNVTLQDQKETSFTREETYKRGFGGLSSRHTGQTTRTELVDSTDVTANTQDLDIISSNNITVTGSNVIGGQDTRLNAGGDILVEAAESTTTNTSFDHKSKFGFSLEGLTLSLGTKKEETDVKTDQTDQVGSTIGSLNGDISLTANDNITIAASDIITRGGDIDVDGDSVDIISRDQVLDSEMRHMVSFTGVSVGLSGGAADSVNSYLASTEAAENTDNDTLKLLHQWKASNALSDIESELASLDHIGKDFENPLGGANESVDAEGNAESSGINVSISLGSSRSETRQNTQQRTAQGSTLSAGGDINITARGDGNNSSSGDITSKGSYISADNIVLDAENDIHLISAENTNDSQSTQKSSNAAIGISFGSDGFNIYAEASKSKGFTNQSDDQYLETQIIANNNITLRSGNNTTLEGAEVRGDSITADIGGDLTITSQQDHSTYEQENKTMGFKAQYGTNSGVSASMSELEANANYLAVQEQSGLFAGDGGFDIEVGNHTALNGGVIVSTADPDNNRISTETLSTQQIQNTTEYSVESTSISVGNIGGMSLSGGHANDDDKQSNTTYSAISNGTIDVRNGDTTALANIKGSEAEAHSILENNFNPDKVKEVQEQAELVAMLAQEGSEFVGDYAQARLDEANEKRAEANKSNDPNEQVRLNAEADQLDANWKEGGILRVASHALVGGISGGIEGALGSAATATIIPELADALSEAGVSEDLRKGLLIAASAGIGSTANGAAGALHSTGQTQFNYLKHEEAIELNELERFLDGCVEDSTCRNSPEFTKKQTRRVELEKVDKQRDEDLRQACGGGYASGSAACIGEVKKLSDAFKSYDPRAAVADGSFSDYVRVSRQYSDHKSTPLQHAAQDALMEMPVDAVKGAVDLAYIGASAIAGDEKAREQVGLIVDGIIKLANDPVNQFSDSFNNSLSQIDELEAAGTIDAHEADKQRMKMFIGAELALVSSATGVFTLATSSTKLVAGTGKRFIDKHVDTGPPPKDRTPSHSNADNELGADSLSSQRKVQIKKSQDSRALLEQFEKKKQEIRDVVHDPKNAITLNIKDQELDEFQRLTRAEKIEKTKAENTGLRGAITEGLRRVLGKLKELGVDD